MRAVVRVGKVAEGRSVGGWWRCFYPRPDGTDAFGDPKKTKPWPMGAGQSVF